MGLIGAFQTVKPETQTIKEEITTSGTWTVPAGVSKIHVMCFGGGGGGDSTCGGGGGYLAQGNFDVTPGVQYAITIGAGGAASTDGGSTTFGDLLTADGGGAPTNHTTGSTSPNKPGRAGSGGTGGGGYGESEKGTTTTTSYMFYPSGSGQYGGDGSMISPYGASDGSGTATANGGKSYYRNSYSNGTNRTYAYGGGGGGMNGGDGGNGNNGGGGGGGGYGDTKFATNGKTEADSTAGYGGFGYGAGGGGGYTPGTGAPGICVIKYNKG